MEYELNATQTLLLKKIFLLFRQVSANVQLVASGNGINLYALNGSNSAWLHIQLGKDFFRRIDTGTENSFDDTKTEVRYWLLSTKNLCQALNVVSPVGAKNQGYSAVFLKEGGQADDNTLRTTIALEKLIIREELEHGNLISFVMCCAEEHIQRSAIVSFENHRVSVPDDISWINWHYIRISPAVLYKSINPYWSPYDDISISYDRVKDQVTLTVVKSVVRSARKTKTRPTRRSGISGKITINGSHFIKLIFDEKLKPPKNVTISLKELLSLSSFCEAVKSPLSLVIRNSGDPVIVVFGEAVDIAENTAGEISVHQVVAEAASQPQGDIYDNLLLNNPNKAWGGSLWLSSMQQIGDEGSENDQNIEAYDTNTVEASQDSTSDKSDDSDREQEEYADVQQDNIEDPHMLREEGLHMRSHLATFDCSHLTLEQRDLIYKTLALDFMPAIKYMYSAGSGSGVGGTPFDDSQYDRTELDNLQARERNRSEIAYSQLTGIW
ncbi:Rad9 [Babesia ovis]|uniref:Rad9 n=1 Tax=Babesia ovis TaxID=5869 RepID=A0A9W5T900_BABOV|nr:Rad9 [Babesia ovis]